jgi:hypothetical protein
LVTDIQKEVQSKKLFKPDMVDEKITFIRQTILKFLEICHSADQVEDPTTRIEGYSKESEYSTADEDSLDIHYEDDDIRVVLADNMKKCIDYIDVNGLRGKENRFCIVRSDRSANMFWYYKSGQDTGISMTNYYVYLKKRNEHQHILVDRLGDSDFDEVPIDSRDPMPFSYNQFTVANHDYPVTKYELLQKFPELKTAVNNGVFKYLPINEHDKRFNEIFKSNSSILDWNFDPKLNGDYDMFIQSGKSISEEEWDEVYKKYKNANRLDTFRDFVKKYMNIAAHFNVPQKYIDEYAQPSDVKRYEGKWLIRLKDYADRMLKQLN